MRLIATIENTDYVLCEVSEFGLVVDAVDVDHVDGVCHGIIHWGHKRRSQFKGTVGRCAKGGRVIENVTGITIREVLQLQRELLRRYPCIQT